MTRYLRAAALCLLASSANAFITVNEGLATTKDGIFVSTNPPRLILNATSYNGIVPSVSLYASSNVVVSNCAIYSTGSITCLGVNLSTAGAGPFVLKTGDTMTGEYFNSVTSTFTLNLSSGIYFNTTKTGINWADGTITTSAASSQGPTGPAGSSSTQTVSFVVDNFLGNVTGAQKTFTLSQTPTNAASVKCFLDGLLQSQTSDYTYTAPTTVAMTTAPAVACGPSNPTNCTSGFECDYTINTSTLPAVFVLNQANTVSSATTFSAGSTTTVLGTSNLQIFLSSQIFSAASSFSFGLNAPTWVSSPTISCELSYTQNTSNAQPRLSFNGDSTTAHYSCFGFWQGAGGSGGFNCANSTVFTLEANITLAGKLFSGAFHYLALPGGTSTNPQFTSGSIDTGSNFDAQFFGGSWTSGGYPSSGTITATAGTMTGAIRCTFVGY